MAKDNRADFLSLLQPAILTMLRQERCRNAPTPTRHFIDTLSTLTSQPADMHRHRSAPPRSQNRLLRLIGYNGCCRTTDPGDGSAGLWGLAGGCGSGPEVGPRRLRTNSSNSRAFCVAPSRSIAINSLRANGATSTTPVGVPARIHQSVGPAPKSIKTDARLPDHSLRIAHSSAKGMRIRALAPIGEPRFNALRNCAASLFRLTPFTTQTSLE